MAHYGQQLIMGKNEYVPKMILHGNALLLKFLDIWWLYSSISGWWFTRDDKANGNEVQMVHEYAPNLEIRPMKCEYAYNNWVSINYCRPCHHVGRQQGGPLAIIALMPQHLSDSSKV